jgi:microcin C transport system permease protein
MIERWIKNELTIKRLRRFRAHKRGYVALWILFFMLFIGATAELWANNKPFVMKFEGQIYAPIFVKYHPSTFHQDGFVTDYRKLNMDWGIWPLIKWDPFEANTDLKTFPAPPTKDNWLGTDDRGRDVFARLIYGFRYSMIYALLVWILAYFVGTVAGAIMGYWGGRIDLTGQRVLEIVDSLPYILVLLVMIALLGASLKMLVIFSVMLGWMKISTYMRAEFLKLRKRDFVEAARAQGLGSIRILFRHILPNAMGPIVTFSPTEIAANITTLAVLDFLGMGLPPPTASLGELLQQAQNNFTIAWWLALYPSLTMVLALTSLTFIGEAVRDALDPHGAVSTPVAQ